MNNQILTYLLPALGLLTSCQSELFEQDEPALQGKEELTLTVNIIENGESRAYDDENITVFTPGDVVGSASLTQMATF